MKVAYTVTEAVAATGLSDVTIRKAIERGFLAAVRKPLPDGTPNPAGKYLIRAGDLDAWISKMPAA